MDSYTRVTHGQIELGPVEFEDEQNDDLDSVEMDNLDAPMWRRRVRRYGKGSGRRFLLDWVRL